MVQYKKRQLTVAEYYRMAEVGILSPNERVELIHGEIITMSPINSLHTGHVKQLNRLLSRLLDENVIISVQDPISLSTNSQPEPDITIVKYRADCYTTSPPKPADIHLIIEVADNSTEYDRNIKMPLYASEGIPLYWIVLPKEGIVEVYQKPENASYQSFSTFSKGDTIRLDDFDLNIAVDDIFLA